MSVSYYAKIFFGTVLVLIVSFYMRHKGKMKEVSDNDIEERVIDPCPQGEVLKDSKCEPLEVQQTEKKKDDEDDEDDEEDKKEKEEEDRKKKKIEDEKKKEEEVKKEKDGICKCNAEQYPNDEISFGTEPYACIVNFSGFGGDTSFSNASRGTCENMKTKTSCVEKNYCQWITNDDYKKNYYSISKNY